MLVLSGIESAKITFTVERQLETTEHLHDDAMSIVMILSKIDYAYNTLAIEKQLEVA